MALFLIFERNLPATAKTFTRMSERFFKISKIWAISEDILVVSGEFYFAFNISILSACE